MRFEPTHVYMYVHMYVSMYVCMNPIYSPLCDKNNKYILEFIIVLTLGLLKNEFSLLQKKN
jgi:hypothetical protein